METKIERNIDPAFLEPYLKRPFEDSVRDHRYLSAHAEELTAQYPDEWVAIFECTVVGHSDDHSDLLQQLEELNLRWKSPAIEFLWATPVNLIL